MSLASGNPEEAAGKTLARCQAICAAKKYIQEGRTFVVDLDLEKFFDHVQHDVLSNILLDELDRELEERGHAFCRYADDSNIYVRSQAAGERVLQSVARFLETRLKLKVNRESAGIGVA